MGQAGRGEHDGHHAVSPNPINCCIFASLFFIDMKYDFDEIINRKGTGCLKYDKAGEFLGGDDVLPMWIADMDLRVPDFIMDALRKRTDHPAPHCTPH